MRSTKITDLATKGGVKSLIHISIDQETKNLCQSKTNLFFQFSKLKYGTITPSDIDGLIEYKNKCYIFFEFKYNFGDLNTGQRLMFERLIRDISKIKPCIFFLASWDDSMVEDNSINAAEAIVYYVRDALGWHKPDSNVTLNDCIDYFINLVDT